jgi:hypothetical protein
MPVSSASVRTVQSDGAVGADALAAHGLMKVPHHGSKGAIVEALDGRPGERLWVMTPWDRGRRLPRFDDREGVALLQGQHPELHLSALPFRSPRPQSTPFRLTRPEAFVLHEQSRSRDARAVARNLPLPVRDGWIEIVFNAAAVECAHGDVAGVIVPAT